MTSCACRELKDGISDGKTQLQAKGEQTKAAAIHVANTMTPNNTLPHLMVFAHPGTEVAQQDDLIAPRNAPQSGAQA